MIFFRIRIRLFYIVLDSDPVSDPAWFLSRNSKFYQLVSSDSFRIRSCQDPDPARSFGSGRIRILNTANLASQVLTVPVPS
jgi:hypothetical protein